MKFLLNSIVLSFCLSATFSSLSAQKSDEWLMQKETQKKYLIQQIVALKVHLGHLKDGYRIAKTGLAKIGDIKQGKFDIDNTYETSLSTISSAVSGSQKVISIVADQRNVVRQFDQLRRKSKTSNLLEQHERDYIFAVYQNILLKSGEILDEVGRLLTQNELQMSDGQRLAHLNRLLEESTEIYSFATVFCNTTRMLLNQRSADERDINKYKLLLND